MKIIRDGKEIELTPNELFQAYEEQEHAFDKGDVESELDCFDDDYLIENYGMTREQIDVFIDEMAYRMRRYMDKYDMSFEYARDEAIRDVAKEYKS